MTPDYARYALYYAPEPGSEMLRLGNAWLGWDAEARAELAPPTGLAAEVAEARSGWIAAPRRYGFHGTLKAPFRLAEGHGAGDLIGRLETFASLTPPVELGRLKVAALGRFLALVPAEPQPELAALAEACVAEFDDFRAPLTEPERARRRPERLSPVERDLLERWGYPYVFEAFHFHVSLTGHLEDGPRAAAEAVLRPLFAEVTAVPEAIESLCLFGDPGGGAPFHLLRRFPLEGA